MPQRLDLALDVFRVLRHFAGQARDSAVTSQTTPPSSRRCQQDDQEYRGQSPQAAPLENRHQRGQQKVRNTASATGMKIVCAQYRQADHDQADHRAGQNEQGQLPVRGCGCFHHGS